jgi:putative sak protein
MDKNYFQILNDINVNDKTEQKGNLTYLSWAWAWSEVKKLFPDSTYTIYENDLGWNYHTDNRTCWVKTGVTVNGIEHIEYLPVMDFKNRSIPLEGVTSFDVNKAIQRSLTKALARHGLGLYIYAGEDLPESDPKRREEEDAGREPISKEHVEAIRMRIGSLEGLTEEMVLRKYNLTSLEEMPVSLLAVCNRDLNAWEHKVNEKRDEIR